MADQTGTKLLSALRRTQSKSALFDTPEAYFEEGEERDAFDWLKGYVGTHNRFPTPDTFLNETGVQTVITKEPVAFYSDKARQRALWQASIPIYGQMRKAFEAQKADEVVRLAGEIKRLDQELSNRRQGMTTLADSMKMLEEDYGVAKNSIGLRGIPTGYPFLDNVTDGWQNSDVISVLGRPGRGKSYELLWFAYNAHINGYTVAFMSGEMGVLSLARRLFGMQMGVDPNFIRKGTLSTQAEHEMRRQMRVMSEGSESVPFYWLAGNFKKTIPSLRAAVYETEPDLIIADASYLVKPDTTASYKSGGRREVIADVIEQLGDLARDVDRPLVQSTQFNRQAIKPKKGSDELDQRNPVAHLTLEKAGETDVVGQVSALMLGLEFGDPPNEQLERYLGLMKGREGEQGWLKHHYKHRPFNFAEITNSSVYRQNAVAPEEAPNLSHMYDSV